MWNLNNHSELPFNGFKIGLRIIILLVLFLGNGCPVYAENHVESIQTSEGKNISIQNIFNLKSELNIGGSHYKDTEDNIVNLYTFSYHFGTDDWKANLGYSLTNASDNIREQSAEAVSFKIDSKVTELLNLGAGLGFNKIGKAGKTNYLTGMVKADFRILNGEVSAELSRDVLAKSVEQIDNKIRITNAGLSISQGLTDRLSLSASYKHKKYSDENNSNDGQFILKYRINVEDVEIMPGYRFRYLDFARQSLGGYFDPDNYASHEFFTSLYIEYKKFYSYIEPFLGYQFFARYGSGNNDFIGGAYSTFGLRLTENILIEANAEGGNYAVKTPSGYKYYYLDFRMNISF